LGSLDSGTVIRLAEPLSTVGAKLPACRILHFVTALPGSRRLQVRHTKKGSPRSVKSYIAKGIMSGMPLKQWLASERQLDRKVREGFQSSWKGSGGHSHKAESLGFAQRV
jgi:hypothetical protein